MADGSPGSSTPGNPAVPSSEIYPIGYSNSTECGYCRKAPEGFSYYAMAKSLTPEFYQKLIDRCWRRSGSLLYRPNQRKACCPHYSLRLDSTQFRPTKDQRQAVNRFNKFVVGEEYSKELARTCPLTRDQARKRDNEFDLVARVSESEFRSLKTPPSPDHKFVVTLELDIPTPEKYEVYENYQRLVHQEPAEKISRNGFERFLCNSPLSRKAVIGTDGKEKLLGSYHQCYRLDGKLVAVGVLDLLPQAVSAVYFMYHESIRSHNPGKLGAMREIALALDTGYRWWYSGFYIHNCPKMKYKIDYSPQYVLDPETFKWDLLDKEAIAIFDKRPYVSLSRERREQSKKRENKVGGKIAGDHPDPNGDVIPADDQGVSDNGAGQWFNDAYDNDDDEKIHLDSDSFLLHSNMPGIPSLDEMEHVDMSGLLIRSDYSSDAFTASQLVVWDTGNIREYGTLKSKIAELVAAIGPDLMNEYCVDFRRKPN